MRKVIVSMNISLDGFMSGPNCELDWHFQSWTKEMADSLYEQLSKADTILLGRVTYKAMAGYWPSKAKELSFPREDIAFANLMNNYTKLVFSRTLTSLETCLPEGKWNNSRLLKGNLISEVQKLKEGPGKDMIVYGSGKIVKDLLNSGLVDEYQLWIHPVLLGQGNPLFKELAERVSVRLFRTKTFSSGVVVLYYSSN